MCPTGVLVPRGVVLVVDMTRALDGLCGRGWTEPDGGYRECRNGDARAQPSEGYHGHFFVGGANTSMSPYPAGHSDSTSSWPT